MVCVAVSDVPRNNIFDFSVISQARVCIFSFQALVPFSYLKLQFVPYLAKRNVHIVFAFILRSDKLSVNCQETNVNFRELSRAFMLTPAA